MINTILILLASSLLSVAMARRLGLSPIVGFILTGVVLGPHVLGQVPDSPAIRQLAEFGIVFLMFTIGLEFSLSRLFSDRFLVLVLGGSSVLLNGAVFAALAAIRLPWEGALVAGMALAMTSTAIVSRLLLEQDEVTTAYGRAAICILLFEDLATILFLLAMPAMREADPRIQATTVGFALAKGVAVFFVLVFAGRRLVRPMFAYLVRLHSPELFMLGVLVVSVGAAAFAHALDLSLALGGFLAGAVLGETEFRHQVESDIRPFQDVLLGFFFITVGMLVQVPILASLWPEVVAATLALVLVKALVISLLARTAGIATAIALRLGITLAHASEFSLVILLLAIRTGLLRADSAQVLLAVVLLSMALAPVMIRHSARIAEKLAGVSLRRTQRSIAAGVESSAGELADHVILCGYGRVGQNIAWYLNEEKVDYVAIDLELDRLRRPIEAGERVTYGDATGRHILLAAGLERAQAVVITHRNMRDALKTLGHVHELRPDAACIVRAVDEQHLDELLDAGATEVIPETLETSLTMAAHVLTLLGVPVSRVVERSDRIRADRYRMLRGMFHGRRQGRLNDRVRIVSLPPKAWAAGRSLGELELAQRRVSVTAIRRRGIRGAEPDLAMRLQAEDALILHGPADALAWAAHYLLEGDEAGRAPPAR